MRRYLFGAHGLLLFRSYLFLAAGLVVVATVLDLGVDYLRSQQAPEEELWLTSTFDLIESELAAVPASERQRRARELGEKIGMGVQILRTDDVHAVVEAQDAIPTLVDSAGNISHLRDAPSLNAIIRLGPVAQQRDSLVIHLLPPLFYLSIFVGLWLRPFFRDINLISSGADRFAADYRKPLSTAKATTKLTSLASNLDDMSVQISGLIQSQKELIAALSHEMRTPLARIRFALAVMDNDGGEDLGERIKALNLDVQEIDDLIATMLNFARLDHPDLQMNWQDVSITPWLAEAQDRVQASNEVTIQTDVASTVARMDPRLMSLALSNLLVNACRYAKREVRCTIAEKIPNYEIRVEDDGEGIPEAERESIFKAFARIDNSRNRETGGFGLGLAIVARIAALHGGNASVRESRELGGACFVLTWPRHVE